MYMIGARIKMMLKIYLWIMGWSGAINAWAWRKQAAIIKNEQQIQHDKLIRDRENSEYLEELKKKL